MPRNLRSIIYQSVPGWSLKAFLQVSARVREFVPDVVISVYVNGEPTALATDDPQIVWAYQEALKWIDKELATGKYQVFHCPASREDFDSHAVWCYPCHLPELDSARTALYAQQRGAIPVFNPIGPLAKAVFAGIPLYGIPVLDAMVRARYAYSIIQLLTEVDLQESIRVPMMEYANSEEYRHLMAPLIRNAAIVGVSDKIDGWMLPVELEWLVDRATEMDSVVELGSWKGRSTTALSAACPGTVYAVDHWKGGKDEPQHIIAEAADDKVYRKFLENTKDCKNVIPIRMASAEAAGRMANPVDMTFIDAGHGYDDVVADIRAWLPMTRRLICGHDYNLPEVKKAVNDELGTVEAGPNAIWFKWIETEARANAAD